jgi:signal-transduction protein with cAMP-binding, CBS, and nucleotidyltransferase domain
MDLEARLQLRQIPYFRALPIARVRELAAALRVRNYNRGEMIFRKGDESEGLCIVLRGVPSARYSTHLTDGSRS